MLLATAQDHCGDPRDGDWFLIISITSMALHLVGLGTFGTFPGHIRAQRKGLAVDLRSAGPVSVRTREERGDRHSQKLVGVASRLAKAEFFLGKDLDCPSC